MARSRCGQKADTMILLYSFFGPYFIPVLLAFFTVLRFGRKFHESDLLPVIVPYLSYWMMALHQDRQGWNTDPPFWIAGIVVGLCMTLRLARWAKPWPWAVAATLLGVAAAYYGYVTTEPTTAALPI